MFLQCSMMIWIRGLDQFNCVIPFGKFALQVRDGKGRKMTVKLSYLSHIPSIISRGQVTFFPTFYDPVSFIIFPLSARCLTHSKTKLPRGLKTNPSSCLASINHLWYTVHIFSEHFRPLLQLDQLSGYIRQHQNSFKILMAFVSGPEYSRDLLSWSSCHRFLFFLLSALSLYTAGGLRMWNLQHLAGSGIPNQQILQTCCYISPSVTVQLLFFIYYFYYRAERRSHTVLCDTQGCQTDKCLDKISIIGTFISLLLIKYFAAEINSKELWCSLLILSLLGLPKEPQLRVQIQISFNKKIIPSGL